MKEILSFIVYAAAGFVIGTILGAVLSKLFYIVLIELGVIQ